MTRITGTSHEDLCTFMIISRRILLRIRSVSDKSCIQSQNTHFKLVIIFRKSCRLWDNVEECSRAGQSTDDSIIRHTRFACWMPKTTNTHSEYVILITFPQQKWLHKWASMVRYTCTVRLAIQTTPGYLLPFARWNPWMMD